MIQAAKALNEIMLNPCPGYGSFAMDNNIHHCQPLAIASPYLFANLKLMYLLVINL